MSVDGEAAVEPFVDLVVGLIVVLLFVDVVHPVDTVSVRDAVRADAGILGLTEQKIEAVLVRRSPVEEVEGTEAVDGPFGVKVRHGVGLEAEAQGTGDVAVPYDVVHGIEVAFLVRFNFRFHPDGFLGPLPDELEFRLAHALKGGDFGFLLIEHFRFGIEIEARVLVEREGHDGSCRAVLVAVVGDVHDRGHGVAGRVEPLHGVTRETGQNRSVEDAEVRLLYGGDLQIIFGQLPPVFGCQRSFAGFFAQHVGKFFDFRDLLILDGPLDVGLGVKIRPVAVAAHLVRHADPIAVEFRFQGESFLLAKYDQGIGGNAAHLRGYPDLLGRQALEEIFEDHAEKVVSVGLIAAPGAVEVLYVGECYVLGEDGRIVSLMVKERVFVGNGAVLADRVDVEGKAYGHAFLVRVPGEGDVVPFALLPAADVGSGHSFAV